MMTGTLPLFDGATDTFDRTPAQHHPYRWRLSRAGFVNVWHYYENTFSMSGGRLILRGTNGSGKSRALEMLLPFLLDADRRNIGAGSSVRMEDLMTAGAAEQGNRLGYMWLELRRDPDRAETDDLRPQYLTLGALIRFAISTKEAKVWYFSTTLRVGHELALLGPGRQPLPRRDLADIVGEERITDVPSKHRERVRTEVFGLTGHLGKERFDGLTKLLHTLRSPDVGNRIEEGKLPAIVADALPPLSEDALTDAGQQLDGLTSTREDQERLEAARTHVGIFLDMYRRYLTGVLTTSIEQARDSAELVRAGERETGRLAGEAEDLERQVTASQARLDELGEQISQLGATLEALKDTEPYRSAEQLTQLAELVQSLAGTADSALSAANELRATETGKVADTDTLADDVKLAAGSLSGTIREARDVLTTIGLTEHGLPAAVRGHRDPAPRQTNVVRTQRDGEPEEIVRPAADLVVLAPADLAALAEATDRVHHAAQTRSVQARNRAADARALAEEQRKANFAQEKANDADERARQATEAAQSESEKRDDAALDLVDRWRNWLADFTTVELLGVAEWSEHPLLGLLVADRTALCGEDADSPITLPDLDRAADDAAASARDVLASALARLAAADGVDRLRAEELIDERAQLRAERDPDPRPPFWVTVTDGIPLWRCLEFPNQVSGEHRAGIEAALLSSGLLTATVDGQGRLISSGGQLLVSPFGDRVAAPLTTVLTPDPASPLPTEMIVAILERIAFEDRSAVTWIGRDGSWGNGPLRGRHTVPAARHVGAAARAASRAQRLAEIDTELDELSAAVNTRQLDRKQIEERQRALRSHLRSAPQSRPLADARIRAAAAAAQAGSTALAAHQQRVAADELTRAWAENNRRHRAACAQFGLPTDEDSLTELHRRADHASGICRSVTVSIATLNSRLNRHAAAVKAIAPITERRSEAEGTAAEAWGKWQTGATRLGVLTETMGSAAAEVQRQVTETGNALNRAKTAAQTTSINVQELARKAGTAAANAKSAADRAGELRTGMTGQVTTVLNQLAQPGVTDTAFAATPGPIFNDLSPDAVDADATSLLNSLRRSKSDENALIRAQQAFEQAISGSYDVSATVSAGIRLFELIDAEGRRPLAQAAIEITRQCELGRAALTEREQRVFTDFVLSEVGEELRRRLSQADALIAAMNTSLKSIQTSHGIGVRLTWKLSEDASGDVARVKELINTAASVRNQAQDAELTGLLSSRVAAESVKDPTSGYATHLRGALDYRTWHVVEVIITGPEHGRERRISRRAKLSQGETRFVSYVTLFAAVDAYLSGLENTATSLRLILLDDAFAKVDEPTIAELLGLLVRLDVDFAMTGHALWGCVPQVPALDIYEICREDGSPAATAHVHWDGRNRHFLRAT